MAAKFGTSGLRGLVEELTEPVVAAYVRAFVAACPAGEGLCVGRDLRASSPQIAEWVIAAARGAGLAVRDCGALPTPALALHAAALGAGAVMVTGSHIPADRNGLKFYSAGGEISKDDEARIVAALGHDAPQGQGTVAGDAGAVDRYAARYLSAFPQGALRGLRVGAFTHSAVGRDGLMELLSTLGAEVVELGRSTSFVPVDTEAVGPALRGRLRDWAAQGNLAAIVSTDGDGDRPLVTDETGAQVAGDVLGQMTAAALGTEVVVTPASSNTGAELSGRFARVVRTRIGSPFVIAGIEAAAGRVAGYEANGGFLLGHEAAGPAGPIAPLRTRDAVLPILIALWRAAQGVALSAQVAAEPARHTAADRLEGVAAEAGQGLVARLGASAAARAALLDLAGVEQEAGLDTTDGLRMALADGQVLHLRPSGNAPEFRVYAEADTPGKAAALCAAGMAAVARSLG